MFDEAAVLEAAAGEFRVHGYAATSTDQLCEAAGVRRSSLYNAFVSKDELFVRALEHYVDTIWECQAEILSDNDLSGGDRLRALIDAVIVEEQAATHQGHAAGCMILQCLMDPGLRQRDGRIARILDRELRERAALLAGVVRAGQIDGSVSGGLTPDDGASLVSTVIWGLRVAAQSAAAPEELQSTALLGLNALLP